MVFLVIGMPPYPFIIVKMIIMDAQIIWKHDVQFEGITQSGHSITMDGAPEMGGGNAGARPMELLLIGMGGCTAFDVVGILKKARAELEGLNIEITAERADEIPKVFTVINLHFTATGKNIKDQVLKRAIDLSAEKYCSASIMLGQMAKITHSYEIVETS